jgi:hypothetical protein
MKVKVFVLSTIIVGLIGCGGNVSAPRSAPSVTIQAAQVFSNHAETWEFKNGYGDLTTIEVQPQPDGTSVWHYTKNADRAYWTPGAKDAELYFTLEKAADGSWYNSTGHVLFPFGAPWNPAPQDFVYTNVTTPGLPRPYLIIGDSGTTLETAFTDFGIPNTRWTTKAYTEEIETAVFSGTALVSEQWEGPCTHEKWYFAPNKGLIKVIPFDTGNCQAADPLLIMERINPPLITAAQVFTPHVGEAWTFQNGYGDTTTITQETAPGFDGTSGIVWHYQKSNCRAYWNPGDCTSELWFGIKRNADTSWSSTQFLATCSSCLGTGHSEGSVTLESPDANDYLVIPPNSSFSTGDAKYFPCWILDSLTWTPNNCGTAGTPIAWQTNGTLEQVSTPIYSGPALVSDQTEGTCPNCTHEKWYFAPVLGIVQVTQFQNVTDKGVVQDDPQAGTMKRIL